MKKKSWVFSFQVAAVYVGTVVGAGFATGREIVEFFTKYGVFGLAGILLAGFLFISLGIKMLVLSKRINAESYQDLMTFLFGRKFGSFVNLFMLIILLGLTSIMLSGAGAIFYEQLNLPVRIGVIITILLTIGVMFFGVNGLFSVNIIVVPMLILFSTILAVRSFSIEPFFNIPSEPASSFKWILSAFSYAAFNLTMSAAVLVPLANEIQDEKVLKRGGFLGGLLLTIILISSHLALSTLPNLTQYEIPMAEAMKTTFYAFYFIYIAVIYGEVFTSVIGNLFGLEKQVLSYINLPRMVIVIAILSAAAFISKFGYSSLISLLYPIFGYICLGVLALLMLKKVPRK
ncbi:YkvI family membrane protein [Metabacillus sp. Hm71]|uniref:YkvI family membrane protein n=1 Tax=Metabacillus sp. Hm71 TaxID=3450743 RepID=UPI003F433DBA